MGMKKSQITLSRQHPRPPDRIGANKAISVSVTLTRLDIGAMTLHAFGVASCKMAGMRNAAQLLTQLHAVGKNRFRRIRRCLQTPHCPPHGSGAFTAVGIRVLFADHTTWAGSALITTSFIVATITVTT